MTTWIKKSNAANATVGDVGAFGGSPVITVRMRTDDFRLNRDTKREAVREFLDAAEAAGGADKLSWRVIANTKGRVNKVTYRSDDEAPSGWYAYLLKSLAEPRELR